MYVVWNDLTQATDFEGTKDECKRYLKDYPGYPGWIQVAADIENDIVVCSKAITPAENLKIQKQTLDGLRKSLKTMENDVAMVRRGKIPTHLRTPYQQREFAVKFDEIQRAITRYESAVISLSSSAKVKG